MKKVLKIVSLALTIVTIFCVLAVPATAAGTTSNGKWDRAYTLIYSDGKCASADTYYMYNAWGKKTVYVKRNCTYEPFSINDIDNFYNNMQFTVKVYKLKNNKYVQVGNTKTIGINGSFTINGTLTKTKYKVVISKKLKKGIYGTLVKNYCYDLNYCISTRK